MNQDGWHNVNRTKKALSIGVKRPPNKTHLKANSYLGKKEIEPIDVPD